ncbi:hypothetical protein ONZ43_g1393 [Nemania bipapillata]|uniref:Uncharacterized protein n=1 Tax=Nemania bipapillata TaxID=110536 RepID=A0ACC2J4L3_9PEZI|nr:hypothetical protein ONZ43_g1393 [Nemania bipapillata]
MEGKKEDLDTKIGQLLQLTHDADTSSPAERREQADYQRLEDLSVTTTSGDTLVIVKFPPGNFVNCHGWKWETKEFFMDSQQLLATGSSVFAEKLSPEGQVHARRCLDRDAKPHLYAKYILNLTPPVEGDELAAQVAQLSLSEGVRDWWKQHFVSNISQFLVYGHDDICPQHIEALISEAGVNVRRHEYLMGIASLTCPTTREIADYCPIRHRAAILRLLLAIAHGELVLNSAPRTVTMAVVAKTLDCANVVTDSVLSWLIAEPNQNFIDINPEEALNISWMLQLPAVARVAFRVLVVERAVDILGMNMTGDTNRQRLSVFGRPRGTVGEEPETCIQHAAQRLGQRVEELLTRLKSDDVHTFLGISEWPDDNPDMCRRLRNYIHRIVELAEVKPIGFGCDMTLYDKNRSRYAPVTDFVPTKIVYQAFTSAQRILTSPFWCELSKLADSYETMERYFREELKPSARLFDSTTPETQQPDAEFDIYGCLPSSR